MSAPQLALVLMVGIFSLAGIPPLGGFMAKLFVFEGLIRTNQVMMAIIIILLSVIALGYYLKMVKVMYFNDQEDTEITVVRSHRLSLWLLSGLTFGLLYIGILPNQLLDLTTAVVIQNT
jgi:NADH-quinone oxidoreductase subunit N